MALNKKIFAWGMYDFANTVFSALFISFFFPFFIKEFLHGNEFQIGIVFGLALLLTAFFVPLLGNISDAMKRRMPFIIAFTTLSCVFTVLIIFGNLFFALLFGLLATFCYHSALSFYNSLLQNIAVEKKGFVSGIGVAMGYLGTLSSLGVAYLVLGKYGWETLQGIKAIFVTIALLFFLLSLFTFFGIKEKIKNKYSFTSRNITKTFTDVYSSVKKIIREKTLRSFLLCLFFFTNAINAVIVFLFLYAREVIGLSVKEFFPAYALFAFVAAIGAFVFGKITDKIGAKKVLAINGIMWLLVIFLLLKITNYKTFLLAGSIGAFGMGVAWVAARPKLIAMVNKQKLAEYFGFLELADKVSGIIGPVVFGFFAAFYSYDVALYSLVVFFVLALVFLRGVPGDINSMN